MSVSMRFIKEEKTIQEEIKPSICQYMSYVHQSVTDMSKHYAQNDKRFNYTTPKCECIIIIIINIIINIIIIKSRLVVKIISIIY